MAKMFYPSFEAINHKSDLTFSEWQNTLLETSGQGGGRLAYCDGLENKVSQASVCYGNPVNNMYFLALGNWKENVSTFYGL